MEKINRNFKNRGLRVLRVRKRPRRPCEGFLRFGPWSVRCALGRGGIAAVKREGDGKTPRGRFALLEAYARFDRRPGFRAPLPMRPIRQDQGWCDQVGDRNYNRPVRLPYGASHEKMTRRDRLYDMCVILDYNMTQKLSRGGSAIFFHLAHPDYAATEGCIAISPADMRRFAPYLSRRCVLHIG